MLSRRDLFRGTAAAAAGGLLARPALAMDPVVRKGDPSIKVSCCAYSYRQYLQGAKRDMTMPDFVDRCAEIGIDGVELTSYYFPTPLTDDYLVALKRRCFTLGLHVSGTSVGNSFTVPAGPGREKQCAAVKAWVDHSAVLGAPVMRVFAGGAPKGTSEDEARKWVVECLEECCDYAGKKGVVLALENHGGVTATADGILSMIKAVKSDWVGVNLDTGNFRGENAYDQIEQVAPYAVTTHFKSLVNGKPADLKRIVSILRKAGYRGYLSLEYEDREDPKTAVPRILKQMKEAVAAAA